MYDLPRKIALQQINALDGRVRLVVIHPSYTYQHLLLQSFVSQEGTIYVSFSGNHLTKDQAFEQLNAAMQMQVGHQRLGDVRQIVLDECDRILPEAQQDFLPALVHAARLVVIFPRRVPDSVLSDSDLRAVTYFLPTEPNLMLWGYTQHDGKAALLEVRAFGKGRVMLNGKSVDNWDGVLPRALFFYLVDSGMTTRNQIFETFWPKLSVREATNVFHVTKRKISEVLGIDLTVYWSGFYRISPDIELSYDAMLFKELVQRAAVPNEADTQDLLQRATLLYRSHFITSLDSEWVKSRRQELLQMYGETLIALGKQCENVGDKKQALGYYLRAAKTNRLREDVAGMIMSIYSALGSRDDALATYDRLERELKTALGVAPAPNIQQLAQQIRAE